MTRIRVLRILEHEFDSIEQYYKVRTKWVQGHVDYGHESISAAIVSETLMRDCDDSSIRGRISDTLEKDDGEPVGLNSDIQGTDIRCEWCRQDCSSDADCPRDYTIKQGNTVYRYCRRLGKLQESSKIKEWSHEDEVRKP